MDFLTFVSKVCIYFLFIFDSFILVMGVAMVIKGIYYYGQASFAKNDAAASERGEYNFYLLVSLIFILPAFLMILLGYVGIHSTRKKNSHRYYSFLVVAFMCAKIVSRQYLHNDMFSFFTYSHLLIFSDAKKLRLSDFESAVIPEYGILIALLLSSLYLIYYNYWLNKKIEKSTAADKTLIEERNEMLSEEHSL